jgi:hypothetical protein
MEANYFLERHAKYFAVKWINKKVKGTQVYFLRIYTGLWMLRFGYGCRDLLVVSSFVSSLHVSVCIDLPLFYLIH